MPVVDCVVVSSARTSLTAISILCRRFELIVLASAFGFLCVRDGTLEALSAPRSDIDRAAVFARELCPRKGQGIFVIAGAAQVVPTGRAAIDTSLMSTRNIKEVWPDGLAGARAARSRTTATLVARSTEDLGVVAHLCRGAREFTVCNCALPGGTKLALCRASGVLVTANKAMPAKMFEGLVLERAFRALRTRC